jgi:hypothetical protein
MTKDWMEPIAARKSRRLTTHQMKDVADAYPGAKIDSQDN